MNFKKRSVFGYWILPLLMGLVSQILYWGVLFLVNGNIIITAWPFWFIALFVVGLSGFVGVLWNQLLREKNAATLILEAEKARSTTLERRIESILELNQGILNIQNEKDLMDLALKAISRIAGVSYSSFVPLDEFENPLMAFTYGEAEELFLKSWAENLVSEGLKNQCKVCLGDHPDSMHPCPLLSGPFKESFTIYCIALRTENRVLGVLNLYLQSGQNLSDEVSKFIRGMLDELGFAVLGIRARNKELAILRQLQLARASRDEFSSIVENMLSDIKKEMDLSAIWLRLMPGNIWPNGINLVVGEIQNEMRDQHDHAYRQVLNTGKILYKDLENEADHLKEKFVIGLPILNSNNQIMGAVLACGLIISAQQIEKLKTLVLQMGLLAQNEQKMLELEYQVVLEERNRLAREIHDGLAQTLALLKLQTSQMQQYLTDNNIVRLAQILNQHTKVLSDAYLDARSTIDNLRLKPENNFGDLLGALVKDFEESSGLVVQTSFSELPQEMMPEIQTQIMRIIQEALNNIRKHANSKKVWINAKQWERDLILDVIDDGKGFTPDEILELSQHGLRGMRERAELIGADFQIISQPGKGTTIRLRLPQYEERTI